MNNDKKEYFKKKLKVREFPKNKNNKNNTNIPFQLSEDSIKYLRNNLINQWMNRKDYSRFVIIDQTKIPTCSNSN